MQAAKELKRVELAVCTHELAAMEEAVRRLARERDELRQSVSTMQEAAHKGKLAADAEQHLLVISAREVRQLLERLETTLRVAS